MTNELSIQSNCNTDNIITNNNISDIRTSDDRVESFSITERNKNECSKTIEPTFNANINIYRFKFTDDFTSELFKFSKIHQYDHRKDFKEAWNLWMEENDGIVSEEVRRLTNVGYSGDILDKMFKSARYYFRKKSTEKKAPAERRIYVGVQKDLLEAMDMHIKSKINDDNYKPSEGFDEFCKENIDLLKEEVNFLCRNGLTDSEEIKRKIKKTYKNRYFLFIKNK
jgi:hypothetical protein